MTNAWFLGASHSVQQDESDVRSTVEPIRTDPQNAEQADAPDWNENATENTDESGQLVGLSPRVAGSFTEESEPNTDPARLALAVSPHNELIDRQVATSGTAAGREEAGEAGHGTMQIEIGIQPLNPAERFGNDYFVAAPLTANEGSGDYMTPVDTDNWLQKVAQENANKQGRLAAQGSAYRQFFSD